MFFIQSHVVKRTVVYIVLCIEVLHNKYFPRCPDKLLKLSQSPQQSAVSMFNICALSVRFQTDDEAVVFKI